MSEKEHAKDGHPFEIIDLPHEKNVKIDKDFVTLIKELNRVGLITASSCQGGKNSPQCYPDREASKFIVFELNENIGVIIKPVIGNKQHLILQWTTPNKNLISQVRKDNQKYD